MSGVEDYLLQEGYFYFVVSHRHRADLIEEYPRLFLERSVDGLIAVDTPWTLSLSVPVVTVSGHNQVKGRDQYCARPRACGGSCAQASVSTRAPRHRIHQRTGIQLRHRSSLDQYRESRPPTEPSRFLRRSSLNSRAILLRLNLDTRPPASCSRHTNHLLRCLHLTTSRRWAPSARCARLNCAFPKMFPWWVSTTSRAQLIRIPRSQRYASLCVKWEESPLRLCCDASGAPEPIPAAAKPWLNRS